MKRPIFSLLAVVLLAGLIGCGSLHGRRPLAGMGGGCAQTPENGQSCDASCDTSGDPACRRCPQTKAKFFSPGCLRKDRGAAEQEMAEAGAGPGPATGAVAYPYYTTRGPRDFLAKNPTSIGP